MRPLVLAATLALLAGMAHPAAGQVALTLSQTPNAFPAPTPADYDAGVVVNPAGVGFRLNVSGPANVSRTTTVALRAASPTLGGGKALSDLEWRRADLATWTAMTTTDATVESRTVHKNQLNDPWSNEVFLRVRLGWTTDGPGTYSTGLAFTLTVTTP